MRPSKFEIYADALELNGEERDAFLQQACGDDAALRSHIERLLANVTWKMIS